jgi:hypothetical protein
MLRVLSLKSQCQNASVTGQSQSQVNQSRKRIPIRNQEKIRIHPNANVLLLLPGCRADLFMTTYNTGCRGSDKKLYSKSTHNIEVHVQDITGINQCP